ncbi:hypothetical protein UPYG_G00200680 [Umbra pygmaea]|uniref:Uncharacterized protein n=1 Tax=Umbra pygmaea TaxID=75934 RepID=A0ABD0WII0_UMBPY
MPDVLGQREFTAIRQNQDEVERTDAIFGICLYRIGESRTPQTPLPRLSKGGDFNQLYRAKQQNPRSNLACRKGLYTYEAAVLQMSQWWGLSRSCGTSR